MADDRIGGWPALPYDAWRETRDTLHMYTQVLGKLRLAGSPFEPEWGNVPLYVTAHGLTTSPIPNGSLAFDVELDLVEHVLVARTTHGAREHFALGPIAVAEFHAALMATLGRMGVSLDVSLLPSEVPEPIPFPDDRVHHSYDPDAVTRFFHVLSHADTVLKAHRAHFRGRTTPVHFFWGTFDLALTRFSGRPAEPPPAADTIMRLGADAEQISVGFWPGHEAFPEPAFYAFGYPKPDGIEHAAVSPDGAAWDPHLGEFVLPYETVRTTADPAGAVLQFAESTYEACASRMRWSPELLGHDRA